MMILATVIVGLATAGLAAPRLDQGLKQTMQLLVLMETDQNGKVSKAEFTKFMDAEFDKLDVNKDGELDVKELTQARYYPHTGVHR
jgi:Ca2+-binding EF-hand superfamily protein